MERILAVMSDPVLPVFAVLVLGFGLSLGRILDAKDAGSINRFVFFLAVPALTFGVLIRADFGDFQWGVVGAYLVSEVLVYAAGTWIARAVFGFRGPEALLLGMTACFSNHILFVLPIATQLYGEEAAVPITAIITLDSALIFGMTVFALEILAAGSGNPLKVFRLMAKNPMILAISAGLMVNLGGLAMPSGVHTFTGFAGAAAAPTALFALGVLLARSHAERVEPVAVVVACLKLAAVPALLWIGLRGLGDPGAGVWRDSTMLVAAGPCGAMPFVLALQYGVRPDAIAKAIVYSTTLSVATLAMLA